MSDRSDEINIEGLLSGSQSVSDESEHSDRLLKEINAVSCAQPSTLTQYQDRFADGLPEGYTPEVTAFFDDRNRLSHWFPRLEATDIPTIDTEILELENTGGNQFLEDADAKLTDILMVEQPEPVLAFFGQPDIDTISEFVENTDDGKAFLRGDFKSAHNLAAGNYIETPTEDTIAETVMHQLQDRIMAEKPLFSPLAVREYLDLDFYPDGMETLHPEVRFFIAEGEVLYHFPRVDKKAFANATNGLDHYTRVISEIDAAVDQLYEWAYQAAQEFDNASWSLDFVMTTDAEWYATDMAINGIYYSEHKNRWHNLSHHQQGSPYNLEEQLGESLPEPDPPDSTSNRR